MLDMHSHILYGVDDGPTTKTESLHLIEQAVNAGVTDIIATSHAFHPQFHVQATTIREQIAELSTELQDRQIPLKLHTGQELRLKDVLTDKIAEGEALTLAGSRYVLIELPSNTVPAYTIPVIQQLLGMNLIPIIAHPERNKAIAEKPNRLYRLITNGALGQITAGSLAGHFGRAIQKTAMQLVEANLVHTYGSDVHNIKTRPALFNEGLDHLEKRKKHEVIDILLENNDRIIRNEFLIQLEPEEISDSKWWRVLK
ncbi:tyrosine-protein phosphatase [Planococcus lenghuensis]|uniref:Tyrosine-protein phosphatase n=1 Tax=Planococcus lenghuensis TaxID=2213202 RepID=A0A1Q2L1D0_9BACL|nr:CpsB/CapC family capsule biosynthesis tyrosine phosphatase [Planococcus lenghuensis]AQQ54216.1 capsular biosynthesis protein [Planococcus lenghuensis]